MDSQCKPKVFMEKNSLIVRISKDYFLSIFGTVDYSRYRIREEEECILIPLSKLEKLCGEFHLNYADIMLEKKLTSPVNPV